MRIFLTGFMGAGKTTYGTELAKYCKMDFIDLDMFIEKTYKKSIHQIFKDSGEKKFRDIEAELLIKAIQNDNVIIATGGGTPCFNNLMDKMNETGLTIYLKHFPDVLYNQLKKDKKQRPLISDMNDKELQAFISNKLKERAYYYNQSKIIIDPDKMTTDKLSKIIIFKYN